MRFTCAWYSNYFTVIRQQDYGEKLLLHDTKILFICTHEGLEGMEQSNKMGQRRDDPFLFGIRRMLRKTSWH